LVFSQIQGPKVPGLGDLKKKKIQGFERYRVSELKSTSEMTLSNLATRSPTCHTTPDRQAVTLGLSHI